MKITMQIEFVIIPNAQMAGMINVFKTEMNTCSVPSEAETFFNGFSDRFPNSYILESN